MARGIKDDQRKAEILKGFAITRIPAKISQNMSEKDRRKMHITPSSSDIDFAKNFLIMEAQKSITQRSIISYLKARNFPTNLNSSS